MKGDTDYTHAQITGIWATPLSPQAESAPSLLPQWATAAQIPPAGATWPENQQRYLVHIRDADGTRGSFGPCSPAVIQVLRDQIAPGLIGQDASVWRAYPYQLLGRHRSGPHVQSAISALELALWDLRSRRSGAPIATLLGGVRRDSVPAYATCLGVDVDHPVAASLARWVADTGFWGQKWRLPGYALGQEPAADAARLTRLREAIGDETRLMVDAVGQWDAAYARRMLPILAAHHIAWVEEPGPLPDGLAAAHGVPVAAGEHDYDRAQQLRTLIEGEVQIWQPDLSWNGGLTSTLALLEVAELLGVSCFPHGSGLVPALHLAALTEARVVPSVEYHLTLEPVRQHGVMTPLTPVDGVFAAPGRPGLGVDFLSGEQSERVVLAGEH